MKTKCLKVVNAEKVTCNIAETAAASEGMSKALFGVDGGNDSKTSRKMSVSSSSGSISSSSYKKVGAF